MNETLCMLSPADYIDFAAYQYYWAECKRLNNLPLPWLALRPEIQEKYRSQAAVNCQRFKDREAAMQTLRSKHNKNNESQNLQINKE